MEPGLPLPRKLINCVTGKLGPVSRPQMYNTCSHCGFTLEAIKGNVCDEPWCPESSSIFYALCNRWHLWRDLIFYCKSCMTAVLMKSWSSAFYIRSERNALPLTFVCVWYTIIKTLYPNLFHVLNCTAECDILYLSSGKMQTLEQHVTSPKRF